MCRGLRSLRRGFEMDGARRRVLLVHPRYRPLPGPTHFSLSCQRKVSKRKARPRWRKPPWIFVAGREGRQTRFAQTSLPSLSSPQQKSKAPSRAGTSTAKPLVHCRRRFFHRRPRAGGDPVSLLAPKTPLGSRLCGNDETAMVWPLMP